MAKQFLRQVTVTGADDATNPYDLAFGLAGTNHAYFRAPERVGYPSDKN